MTTPGQLTVQTLTDIVRRDDIRGLWPEELSAEVAWRFGEAFAAGLCRSGAPAPVIVVGYDARTGSPELALALARGVREAGGQVEWLGLASTEHVYYMTGRHPERYAGGAMITASHNPAEYNGIKFVFAGARPLGASDLQGLRDYAAARLNPPTGADARSEFAAFALECTGVLRLPATAVARWQVVVAAGHGVGAWAFAPLARALESRGFRFTFLEPDPDGSFPGGVPNPLVPQFVRRLGRAVRAGGAQLGIGFDGDGDRAGFVDSGGREITASQVLALVAEPKLAGAKAPALLLRNLCCSQLLVDCYAARPEVTLVDTPVGHGKVKLLLRHPAYRDGVVMAGEHSGHYYYPEFYHVDSGMLTALYMLKLLAEATLAGRRLETRLSAWRQHYAWSGEINYRFASHADQERLLDTLAARYATAGGTRYEVRPDPALGGLERVFANPAPYERTRLQSPDVKYAFPTDGGRSGWWFVVRPSGNEPQLRLNVESWGTASTSRTRTHVAALAALLEQAGGIRLGAAPKRPPAALPAPARP